MLAKNTNGGGWYIVMVRAAHPTFGMMWGNGDVELDNQWGQTRLIYKISLYS